MAKLNGIIVLLGDKNDSHGELSTVSMERARACVELYTRHSGCAVVPTGGCGDFSRGSFKPHAYFLSDYLIDIGLPREAILATALGRNTLENVLLVRDIVNEHDVETLYIVTSDFHRRRAQYIFEQLFEDQQMKFFTSHTALPVSRIQALEDHETRAWGKLLHA